MDRPRRHSLSVGALAPAAALALVAAGMVPSDSGGSPMRPLVAPWPAGQPPLQEGTCAGRIGGCGARAATADLSRDWMLFQLSKVGAKAPASSKEVGQFRRTSTGTCADAGLLPVTNGDACEAAARHLGLEDTSVSATNMLDRPEGCYYYRGAALWLGMNPRNQGNGAETSNSDGSRHPICGPQFQKVTTGTCMDVGLYPITRLSTCEAAAAALGLADTLASSTHEVERPEGCYWFNNRNLWIGVNHLSWGQGAEKSGPGNARHPICTAKGRWQTGPWGQCDPELSCHRSRDVECKSMKGVELPMSACDLSVKPTQHERCLVLGTSEPGSCVDIAPSDCMDVPGRWWNKGRRTCKEVAAQSNGCGNSTIRDACPVSCGLCDFGGSSQTTTPPSGQSACQDDQWYRTPFGNSCSSPKWEDHNCNGYTFSADLKIACPKACRQCALAYTS